MGAEAHYLVSERFFATVLVRPMAARFARSSVQMPRLNVRTVVRDASIARRRVTRVSILLRALGSLLGHKPDHIAPSTGGADADWRFALPALDVATGGSCVPIRWSPSRLWSIRAVVRP